MANEFIGFYQGLLGVDSQCATIDLIVVDSSPKVSFEQSRFLFKVVSKEKIKSTIFTIGEDKSPGPDGFTTFFFKKAWNSVGDLFCDAVLEFFHSGSLLKSVNNTTVMLIPKSARTSLVQDFWPISCYNITYKVISKVLAAWLAPIISSLIDQTQWHLFKVEVWWITSI